MGYISAPRLTALLCPLGSLIVLFAALRYRAKIQASLALLHHIRQCVITTNGLSVWRGSENQGFLSKI